MSNDKNYTKEVYKMLFNSITFAIFLPVVFIVYWSLPHKFQWVLILLSSYYFYMCWSIKYVFLILFTTIISYGAAILLEGQYGKNKKRIILAGTTMLCLGTLFFFKYFNFVSESLAAVLSFFTIKVNPITLKLLLPVGISFYTFQTLSYVIDVYKGDVPAEHHFGYYATFISFFPQLVAGPIERTNNLLPQIKAKHNFDYNQSTYGLKLMAWGYYKKVVIADTLSTSVNAVYNSPQTYQGLALILATVFFAIQIYCDFSGYSDIAIGTAKLLGINLMTNFKSPYFSASVKEFWSRWHISLSSWFRDYVYIPLGGNRVGKVKHSLNLIITFLVSGLWHGANWTFVAWGGIHGIAQVLENVIASPKKKKNTGIVWLIKAWIVFVFCSFAWIFFVADTIGKATYVIRHLFSGINSPFMYLYIGFSSMGLDKLDLLLLALSIMVLVVYDYISLKEDVIILISSKKTFVRWIIYIAFSLWAILSLPVSDSTEFIYFQF